MEKFAYGMNSSGVEGTVYVLKNENGMKVEVVDYGAVIAKIEVPDKEGNLIDVVLGYDDVKGYEEGSIFLGAPVGRSANRIGGASFSLNGIEYALTKNDNDNNLHSGLDYYHLRFWNVKKVEDNLITFTLISEDGDQGYPGTVEIEVTYEVTSDNELRITYDAITDKDTIVNLTNHSYFNLDGHASGDILSQEIWLDSDAFTRADAQSIPTGEIVDVDGTPMDFRSGKVIGAEIDADYEALILGGGYDHNWLIKTNGEYKLIGSLESKVSGIKMEVYTDLPGVQIYTGNFINNEAGKGEVVYKKRAGVCFETQYYPDAIHHEEFPSPVLKVGEKYHTVTGYKFVV